MRLSIEPHRPSAVLLAGRVSRLACAFLLVPAAAYAAPAPVVGGTTVPDGKWPDVAAVLYAQLDGTDQQACTGTLVAPTIVLTAGHCNDPTLDNVWLGTVSLASGSGEVIGVVDGLDYPDLTIDVTVLVLAQPAQEQPRALATGWASFDIVNGAPVEVVGYGAVDPQATQYVNEMQEAATTIVDANCDNMPGCNAGARPAGELAAGGGGVDTCNGDSGGPLYLSASYGTFLAGITSRSYDNAAEPCGGGGIYERADRIADWIEQTTGVAVTRGPEPSAAPIAATTGNAGETHIDVNDPKSTDHTFALYTPPSHGRVAVREDGQVRYCADPTSTGSDGFVVSITDVRDQTRVLGLGIAVDVGAGTAPAAACDPQAYGKNLGGGCSAGGGGVGWLVALALVITSRRWRRRG